MSDKVYHFSLNVIYPHCILMYNAQDLKSHPRNVFFCLSYFLKLFFELFLKVVVGLFIFNQVEMNVKSLFHKYFCYYICLCHRFVLSANIASLSNTTFRISDSRFELFIWTNCFRLVSEPIHMSYIWSTCTTSFTFP